ncbi:Protein bud22 [Schizosaccharomyces pombe]|uniref:Protein bud22 n=1 Tax=Schizosaccharomyces pombe (strain 972 / ATCC 24843) TaxID=284812 RepID=BUD22_SCHPO|nr:putative BUD22 family ribosome small subunit biogenesis protein [Schizosaccharomyces pombe]O36018.1 RecName: Full=Protein bud22 [Schizosaccharomyces pombe 972h-]CAB11709.1 ribosome small subunit biogenesis protein, BUD22 family (predicted) [Schizosaccharomyces pombe]|eukprot:NP_594749.1 putative BUD22 family ribosome small subunit biogenesis protein [Schizosaccharomyces pombe]
MVFTSHKGVKRKSHHSQLSVDDVPKKIPLFKKKISQALKKASTFERQKLVRRIKNCRASEDADTLGRFEAEFEFAKQFDFTKFVDYCYYKKILKNKDFRKLLNENLHVDFPADLTEDAQRNTVARILNSKQLSDAIRNINSILEKYLRFLNPDLQELSDKKAVSSTQKPIKTIGKVDLSNKSTSNQDQVDNTHVQNSTDGVNQDTGMILDNTEDKEINKSMSYSMKNEGVKESSLQNATLINRKSIIDDEMLEIPLGKHNNTNLPALTAGFLDPVESDDEFVEKELEEVDIPKRKNRRGQRARQAIWEKKYGKGANHLIKKATEERSIREERQRKYEERQAKRAARENAFTEHQTPQKPEQLHPSWEAKRKQKMPSSAAFQGKKIVFD